MTADERRLSAAINLILGEKRAAYLENQKARSSLRSQSYSTSLQSEHGNLSIMEKLRNRAGRPPRRAISRCYIKEEITRTLITVNHNIYSPLYRYIISAGDLFVWFRPFA